LGLVDREIVHSLRADHKLLSQTLNRYDPDGLLVSREVYNQPLVFLPGKDGLVEPKRQEVAQVRKLQYDGYRRLSRDIAPDGLVQEYTYGPDSRVASLNRYHVAEPDHKEILTFEYDSLGRVIKVQGGTGPRDHKTLQEFDYDWRDHVIRAVDYAHSQHTVEVRRRYDNLGLLLEERVRLPKDGFQEPTAVHIRYNYDLLQGRQTASLQGLDDGLAGWRTLEVQQDLVGRVRTITKDSRILCQLEYVGLLEVLRRFEQAGVLESFCPDPFLELKEQCLTEEGSEATLYEMLYLRDDRGRVAASSIRVPSNDWECSSFYDRDDAGHLTAENKQAQFFDRSRLSQKRKDLLQKHDQRVVPEDIGMWHVRRQEYDEASNMIATYRGPATGRWPKGAELASSWDPRAQPKRRTGGLLPERSFVQLAGLGGPENAAAVPSTPKAGMVDGPHFALASNRTACKAQVIHELPCSAIITTGYQYDRFGCLINYHSRATGRPLRWEIEYDVLGCIVGMKGFCDESQCGQSRQEAKSNASDMVRPLWVLGFAYDPFNRRIVKHIHTEGKNTTQVMLYTGQRPAVTLRKTGSSKKPWAIQGQYIWGAGPSRALAYYESAREEFASQNKLITEYLLHQDAAYNVVLSTRRTQDKGVEVFDIASYWGLGENSTVGVIQEIVSSLPEEKGRERKYAFDRVLDNRSAQWRGKEKEPGFLTLKLVRQQRLSAAEIWAHTLPSGFRTYVVGEGEAPNLDESLARLAEWERQHKQDRVTGEPAKASDNFGGQASSASQPRRLFLDNCEGQEIVLIWDNCQGDIAVREFEVFVEPLRPGDMAFSGAVYDAETGLYYHGNRYRLPELGTFISPDPLGFLGGDNLYAFAYNDPLTWHDPDGRLPQILLGAGVGGVLGAGNYIWKWWWHGEEWSWVHLGMNMAAGAASGAVAAAVAPAALFWMGKLGFTATVNAVVSGTVSGAAVGASQGAIHGGVVTYLQTGDILASLREAAFQAAIQGGLGAMGGGVGGAVASGLGASFWGIVASGACGGAAVGAVTGAYEGYLNEGTISGALLGMAWGAGQGALVGGIIGASAWGVGRATGQIRPLPKQPEGLPDMRSKGILIRRKPPRGDYGGVPVKPGYARHHIKPLSLGGTDTPDNIVELPIGVHRQPHPGPAVTKAPYGTIFY
jgi:RHS repeat-associated protein